MENQIGIIRYGLHMRQRSARQTIYVEWRNFHTIYQDLEGDIEDLIYKSIRTQENDMKETLQRMEDELKKDRVKLELRNELVKKKKEMEAAFAELIRKKRQEQLIEADDMGWNVTVSWEYIMQ